jgi:hypothetical protein
MPSGGTGDLRCDEVRASPKPLRTLPLDSWYESTMEGSEIARALVKRRWAAVDARQKVRGKWTGERNPNFALSAEQKRAIAKRLTEGRYRRDAAKRALQMMAAMDELRAMTDALWGDWRPKPPRVQGPPLSARTPPQTNPG